MTNIYKIVIGMSVFLCLILAACITAVDEALPYPQLPAITVATEVKLTASPAHPTAYLPIDPIPAGERVEVIGTDKNAAWLLVLHNNILGWMPTFFSRDNVGTLSAAFAFEPLSEGCTTYLDATFAPEAVWNSTVSGAVIALGAIYQPNTQPPVADTTLSIAIDGAGQAVEADYVSTSLTTASSVILFAFEINDVQKGSQLHFTLTNAGSDAFFQAAFFSDSCAQTERFTSQLPVGKPKVILAQPTATPQTQAAAGVQNETVIITKQSDSRTPQPTATPTPIPTLDSVEYGETVAIVAATASSLFWGDNSDAKNAIDGNILSEWSSDSNDDIGAWLELSLPEPKRLTGIHIYTLGVNGPSGQPQDISLLFSDSSQQHIHLENIKGWQYHALTPVTTKSIKLIVDSVYNVNMFKTTRLYEIQLLSKPLPPPQIVAADNPAVSIGLQSDFFSADAQALGRMKLRFLKQDQQSITQGAVTIFPLEQDVAGNWIRTDAAVQNQQVDEDGFYMVDLPSQSYLVTVDAPANGDEPIVPGWYSDARYEEADSDHYRGIIFPVQAGKTTEIEVNFSRLVVGVINEAGKAMRSSEYPGWTVMVCADDLAAVADETLRCAKNAIDRRGAATFQLAPGAYHLRVLTETACYWEFPVSVALQEMKEEIVTIASAQPDGCPQSGQ
ncbi:MAG: NADase-type glycan-binding domain-containing protein [Caldilineaceae bacterium]